MLKKRAGQGIALFGMAISAACTSGPRPLDAFVSEQKGRIAEKAAYVQADFDFWASAMAPTERDLRRLQAAWQAHGEAFPESAAIREIQREVGERGSLVVLVSLFMSDYDNADLKNKALGWTVAPEPKKMVELSEADVVLRTLMPVRNAWARYFLLRYSQEGAGAPDHLVVSNRSSKIELPLLK